MPTFRYAKLVRDKIPNMHRTAGHVVNGSVVLKGDELMQALVAKLHEETDEIHGVESRDELIEEIGDVQQVIWDMCTVLGVMQSELNDVVKKKTMRKGSYVGGKYVDSITIPADNDVWATYCRAQPEKYPEISLSESDK